MNFSKIILSGIVATTMMGTSFAANHIEDSITIAVVNDDLTPKEIKLSELPQAVQEALKANKIVAERAFLLYKDEQAIYEIEAKKDGEKIILRYDASGKEIVG